MRIYRLYRIKAEQVLGRPLKGRECVHHVDYDRSNDENKNLVICPNDAYHMLLHRRQRALEECGNADWVRCQYCGKHDQPENIVTAGSKQHHRYHRSCRQAYQRAQYREKSLAL